MPTISYYFNTGPWRNLWVKFGYDPRTDSASWCYQTFDFRIRQAGKDIHLSFFEINKIKMRNFIKYRKKEE